MTRIRTLSTLLVVVSLYIGLLNLVALAANQSPWLGFAVLASAAAATFPLARKIAP